MSSKEKVSARNSMMSFRVSRTEKLQIQLKSAKGGVCDSDYIRDVLLNKEKENE